MNCIKMRTKETNFLNKISWMIFMKQWYDSKFGKVPYKDVVLIEFSFDAKTQMETTKKQYELMLIKDVLQVHLGFAKMEGIIILSTFVNPELIFKKAKLKTKIISKKIIPYEKVIEENLMHE